MPIKFTEEQEMFRETARNFSQKDVEPLANAIDRDDTIPTALYKKAAELGFYGLYTPEAYGGLGQNLTSACLVLEEIAKASPSLAGILSVQWLLCPKTMDMIGTEEQKQRFLTASATGEKAMAWSSTEPSGTIYHRKHQARITPDGNGYRLDGVKIFCTQGEADTFLVFTKSEKDGRVGYGGVIVERGMEGFKPAKPEDKLGWRGTNTGTIVYDNIYIPAENLLGDFYTARQDVTLANSLGSMGHSATSLGCLEGMFDKTVAYVKDRELYGAPMSRLQPVSYWLAEIWAKIEACRALLYATAASYDDGRPDELGASACKAYIGDTAAECTSKLLQLWGGSGIMNDTGVNRYYRDAKTKLIAEGSSEIHYDGIASYVLGIEGNMSFEMDQPKK